MIKYVRGPGTQVSADNYRADRMCAVIVMQDARLHEWVASYVNMRP